MGCAVLRRHVSARGLVILLTALPLASLLAFDVLDLDGSDLDSLFADGQAAAVSTEIETARLVHTAVWLAKSILHDGPPRTPVDAAPIVREGPRLLAPTRLALRDTRPRTRPRHAIPFPADSRTADPS